ncbi:MAG TPA: hypothetical protein VN131_03630 [Mobilitalea sp.]|nr:hypothetical protein [Mobilitalea sp.]
MSKKNIFGLIVIACLTTACLFTGAHFLTSQGSKVGAKQNQSYTAEENNNSSDTDKTVAKAADNKAGASTNIASSEPWLSTNPSDSGSGSKSTAKDGSQEDSSEVSSNNISSMAANEDSSKNSDKNSESTDVLKQSASNNQKPQLIIDSSKVDYMEYIPNMVVDNELADILDIDNPSISVDAKSAILFDADTKKVLYYKNPVVARFPASTAKLLTSLVALDWCKLDEQITVGDEITMIAPDSTRAGLKQGEVLTMGMMLEAMLLPSGNDAAYATAAYVGRKALQNPKATKEEAINEFAWLMNMKAQELGVKNSNFKTPDGYDAIGQYTTACDMGLIAVAAVKNDDIMNVTKKTKASVTLVSGQQITWSNTNKLITQYSGEFYSYAIGMKTGTSTMAGRCLIAAAKKNGREVVAVIMNSSIAGRWEDAISLLKYGLK